MTTRTPPATPEIARAERQGYAACINGRERDACPCRPVVSMEPTDEQVDAAIDAWVTRRQREWRTLHPAEVKQRRDRMRAAIRAARRQP